jgi:hypothetical protein
METELIKTEINIEYYKLSTFSDLAIKLAQLKEIDIRIPVYIKHKFYSN